ncbi:TPA: hypothetical protein PRN89_002207 [Staphylococcus aureus]|nr:hypothetical protein [Staphylococcus aureus]
MPKEETAQLESIEEVKETSADLTKDYVLSVGKEFLKKAPMPKEETAQLESIEEVKETSADLTKDYVLSVGKEFLKKADTSDKKEFRNKLNELGADKLSTIKEEYYEKIVDFMKARINA